MRAALPLWLTLLLVSSCDLSDPCPSQWVRRGDRCVRESVDGGRMFEDANEPAAPRAEDGPTPIEGPMEPHDAGELPPPRDGMDAGRSDRERGLDATQAEPLRTDGSLVDDASPDSSPGPEAGPAEAAVPDTEAGSREACGVSDLSRWRNFQRSGLSALRFAECSVPDPTCGFLGCGFDACMRDAAGVTSCAACVARERTCISAACLAECTTPNAYDDCRRCACANGCFASGCGPSDADMCSDCQSTECLDLSVPPALIMQAVNQMLVIGAPAL